MNAEEYGGFPSTTSPFSPVTEHSALRISCYDSTHLPSLMNRDLRGTEELRPTAVSKSDYSSPLQHAPFFTSAVNVAVYSMFKERMPQPSSTAGRP